MELKLWVLVIGADNIKREFVFNRVDYNNLDEILKEKGLEGYKIVNWKLKRISFFE